MQLTQIVNGQVTELILCESCARKKGLFDPQSLSFAEQFFPEEFKKKVEDLVKELADSTFLSDPRMDDGVSAEADAMVRCPVCDFTLEAHRRTGRLGCPDCYSVFARELESPPATENNTQPPPAITHEESPALTLKKLEQQLREAIEREDYEKAAELRDRIRELS